MYRSNNTTSGRWSLKQASHMFAVAVLLVALILTACESSAIVEPDVQRDADAFALSAHASTSSKAAVNRQLAAARAGTAGFHKIEDAVDAGFALVSPCVEDPTAGGMGYHYLNPVNTALDPANPQLLLYEPQKNGRLRLVGVEYLVPYDVVPESADPPRLFDQDFHPTPHLEAWTLHAWVWRDNPVGLFVDYNPRVSCQYAE